MRKSPSPIEQRLWRALRRHAAGVHFRRQHPIGPFIVDFCAPRNRLVIEVDGDTHGSDEAQQHDKARESFLCEMGFTVIRFANRDVVNNLEGVVGVILDAITPPAPPNEDI
ncbi:endonuclease domain-containing protein [candidate division KSB1 bacterium]|nr:endonuclease domain-containing protein [candidate division KSB1 bacterium]